MLHKCWPKQSNTEHLRQHTFTGGLAPGFRAKHGGPGSTWAIAGAIGGASNHLKHGFFNTKIKGNHHLQGNVQVYNVRIPVPLVVWTKSHTYHNSSCEDVVRVSQRLLAFEPSKVCQRCKAPSHSLSLLGGFALPLGGVQGTYKVRHDPSPPTRRAFPYKEARVRSH